MVIATVTTMTMTMTTVLVISRVTLTRQLTRQLTRLQMRRYQAAAAPSTRRMMRWLLLALTALHLMQQPLPDGCTASAPWTAALKSLTFGAHWSP